MTQRTCNIIQACKGNLYPEIEDKIERIKIYMSEECACSQEAYTEDVMNSIMINAMCDYIDTCDKPSVFLRLLLSGHKKYKTCAEQICSAFTLIKVKNGCEYINGFKEEFFK